MDVATGAGVMQQEPPQGPSIQQAMGPGDGPASLVPATWGLVQEEQEGTPSSVLSVGCVFPETWIGLGHGNDGKSE